MRVGVMLLIGSGLSAIVVWKWPVWQYIPLETRRSPILNGFTLSWVTYLSFVAFHLAWNSDDSGFIVAILIIGAGLGLALFFVTKRLYAQSDEMDELFP